MTTNLTIGKTYSFDAAHQLVGHNGKCANVHGHTYEVTVEVSGLQITNPYLSDSGMLMDYADLDEIVKPIIDDLDHAFLIGDGREDIRIDALTKTYNIGNRTTAEHIARHLHVRVRAELTKMIESSSIRRARRFPNIYSLAVTVSETPKTFARFSEDI